MLGYYAQPFLFDMRRRSGLPTARQCDLKVRFATS
jgi:hypothetical protein